MLSLSFIFIASLLVTAFAVRIMVTWLQRQGVLDVPNQRSSHTRPTPKGGGAVIVAVTLIGVFLLGSLQVIEIDAVSWTYVAAACIIATVSWMDDLAPKPVSLRLACHCLSAALLLVSVRYKGFWIEGAVLPVVIYAVVGVWIVGLTNAYNFMDGIDGIAGTQAFVAGCGWTIIGSFEQLEFVAAIGVLLSGTSLGFLLHNWHPARVFMGDVGSAFLGFTFGAVAVIASLSGPRLFVCGAVVVWPFVADAAITLLRRLVRGERITEAHCSHLYQRLVQSGLSHSLVSLVYGLLAVICTAAAVAYSREMPFSTAAIVFVIIGSPAVLVLMSAYLAAGKGIGQKPESSGTV